MIETLKTWIESLPFIDERRVWWNYEGWRPWSPGIDLGEGELLPVGYGVSWRRHNVLAHRCYPVPLNLLLGALRAGWVWVSHTLVPNYTDNCAARAYAKGRSDGFTRGYEMSQESRRGLRNRISQLEEQLEQHRKVEEAIREASTPPRDDEWPNEPYERQVP